MAPDMERSQQMVRSGLVLVNGSATRKPERLVQPGDAIRVPATPRFVSRGGYKLEAALGRFGIDVAGLRCIDVGSSTGGFSDCLLQRGASELVAVDVGRALLHERVASSPAVEVCEGVNARFLRAEDVGGPADLVCADVSFISLKALMPALSRLSRPGAHLVLLVKPQFEASRREVERGGGVILESEVWRRVLGEVADSAESAGLSPVGVVPSPITGARGNVEFFLHVLAGPAGGGASLKREESKRPFDGRLDGAVRVAAGEAAVNPSSTPAGADSVRAVV